MVWHIKNVNQSCPINLSGLMVEIVAVIFDVQVFYQQQMFLFGKKQEQKKQLPKSFKEVYSFEQRVQRRLKYQSKYPKQKCALVVVEGLSQFQVQGPNFFIYGVQNEFSVLMLMEYIRNKLPKMNQQQSFFVKIRNQVIKTTDSIGQLYKRYSDEDGFMYVELKKESIF